MKNEFLKKTKMLDKNGQDVGVRAIADFMFLPETIYKLKLASDMGLPVLTLVAHELEVKFNSTSSFPLVVTPERKNATYRQNVGRIAKYIMNELGYKPIDGGLSERARIPAISKADFFCTSAIYEKNPGGKYTLTVSCVPTP